MATAFDNTKYDVQINDVPYRIAGYQRSELSTFIPRLGAGEQKESQFDLLRSSSVGGFAGGSLQRFWQDETSAFGIEGLFPKYDDGVLYPVQGLQEEIGRFTAGSYDDLTTVTAWCSSEQYLFTAVSDTDLMTFNGIQVYRTDKSGTTIQLTIGGSPSTSSNTVTDMVIYNNQLWITTTEPDLYYMDLSSTTLNLISAGSSGAGTNLAVYRGELYLTNSQYSNRRLYRYTGTTATKSWEQVADTGKSDYDTTAQLFVYNNRLIMTKQNGMYGYDGIQLNVIEDKRGAESAENYRYPTVLRGYLYYFMPDGMYRFNGSLIEKLYDRSEIGFPSGMSEGDNKLWITYNNSQYSGSSRYDKSMGYDYSSSLTKSGRLMVFDGSGLFTYGRFPTYQYDALKGNSYQGDIMMPIYFNGDVYITTRASYDQITYKTKTAQTTSAWRIVTSIFDGGFPQITKYFENIQLSFDGTVVNQNVTVEYRISGFDTSSGWTSYGTLSTGTGILYTYENLNSGLEFEKIQFRLSATTNLSYGIEKIILRYILQPDYKYRWSFVALCYGDDQYGKLNLQDQTQDTQSVDLLRGNIYASRESNVPISFVDIDWLKLNGSINSAVTTITIDSDKILKSTTGLIQIGTEIMKYTKATSTTLTVVRGYLGTTASSHSDNACINLYYRVILRQIQNERIELSDEERTDKDTTRDSEITLVLEEV